MCLAACVETAAAVRKNAEPVEKQITLNQELFSIRSVCRMAKRPRFAVLKTLLIEKVAYNATLCNGMQERKGQLRLILKCLNISCVFYYIQHYIYRADSVLCCHYSLSFFVRSVGGETKFPEGKVTVLALKVKLRHSPSVN